MLGSKDLLYAPKTTGRVDYLFLANNATRLMLRCIKLRGSHKFRLVYNLQVGHGQDTLDNASQNLHANNHPAASASVFLQYTICLKQKRLMYFKLRIFRSRNFCQISLKSVV